jgi:hypothetical protein
MKEILLKNEMQTKYRSEKSANGFDMSTLKSAIQKYIRRGNEEMALRSVEEIDRFAEVKDGSGERLRTNMLHRLQIIFLEDIGLGNYHLWKKLCKWFDILYESRESDSRDRGLEIKTLKKIVINLCRSKKTRSCSFMNSLTQLLPTDKAIIDEHFGGYFFDVPELTNEKMLYEFDKTLKEKDWKSIHYLRKLFTSAPVKDIEKIMEKHGIDQTCSKKWKKNKQSILKLTEGFLLYMLPLGFYLYGSEELQLSKDIGIDQTSWPKRGHFEMDDFVFDKHTKCAIDRSTEYFVKETSKVSNEVFIVPDEFKAIYEWSRCGKIVIEKKHEKKEEKKHEKKEEKKDIQQLSNETDLDFVVRIQLTTSNQKQDTYYAEYNKELYFVKGPFKDSLVIDNYIKFQELKKERGIPYMKDVYCLMLYPNRWTPEETPLGYRKSIDPKKQYPFLIAKSLIYREQIKTRVHSSVKWPATTIVDDHETNGMRIDVFKLKDQMMIDYLNAIAFRLEYNIGDFADRNFLRIDSRVLSVDEEITKNKKVNLKSELKVKKYNHVMKAFETYKDKLDQKTIEIFSKEL